GLLRHRERERQQDRHSVRAAQPREHADDDPEDHPDEHQHQVERREGDAESAQQCVDFFHSGQPRPSAASSGPLGRGTWNHVSNIRKKATLTPTETGTVLNQEYLPSCHMKYAMYSVDAT